MITVIPWNADEGYRYWSRARQLRNPEVQWLGLVTWNGVKGALGCDNGTFYMYRHHLDRLAIPREAVIMAIAAGSPDGRSN